MGCLKVIIIVGRKGRVVRKKKKEEEERMEKEVKKALGNTGDLENLKRRALNARYVYDRVVNEVVEVDEWVLVVSRGLDLFDVVYREGEGYDVELNVEGSAGEESRRSKEEYKEHLRGLLEELKEREEELSRYESLFRLEGSSREDYIGLVGYVLSYYEGKVDKRIESNIKRYGKKLLEEYKANRSYVLTGNTEGYDLNVSDYVLARILGEIEYEYEEGDLEYFTEGRRDTGVYARGIGEEGSGSDCGIWLGI